jgi:uncharacterized protein (TIGR00725 family)
VAPGRPRPCVAVVGAAEPDPGLAEQAYRVGALVARAGAVVVTGGLGGVMEAASRGAAEAGGLAVGLLPGGDRRAANPWVGLALPTGLGEARNVLVVRAADAVVAVGGGYGTLSEVALALKLGRPVVGLGTWGLLRPDGQPDPGVVPASDPESAVGAALALAGIRPPARPDG